MTTQPHHPRPDPGKWRRMVGAFALLIFIPAYIAAVLWLHDQLPKNQVVDLLYFVVTGIGWGLPVLPLLSWMGKAK